jgi:DNA-nicking Smr family endonuclease
MASSREDPDQPDVSPDAIEAEAAIVLPIEDTLDLHTFAPRDIPELVREYLTECARRGLREVRVIHGRGTGTQRAVVRAVLAGHPLVETLGDAPPERGGWGATVVRLRAEPRMTNNQ